MREEGRLGGQTLPRDEGQSLVVLVVSVSPPCQACLFCAICLSISSFTQVFGFSLYLVFGFSGGFLVATEKQLAPLRSVEKSIRL